MAIHSGQIMAIAIFSAVGAWLVVGSLAAEPLEQPIALSEQFPNQLSSVMVRDSQASHISELLELTGTTQANKELALVFEASGRVVSINKTRGQKVSKGEIIAQLDTRDLEAQLASARSTVEARRQDLEATRSLVGRGLQNQTQLASAQAVYDQAVAQRASLEIAISNSKLEAPFDGVLEQLGLELGSFVSAGQQVGKLLNYEPLIIQVEVPEADINRIEIGSSAQVKLLAGGQHFDAKVDFISSSARSSTRTFLVELKNSEPLSLQVSGLTARVNFQLPGVVAHFVSPALLQLTEDGQLAIRVVEEGRVVEHPISIIRTQTDGVWISGLEPQSLIITRGQGFVSPGEQVSLVQE